MSLRAKFGLLLGILGITVALCLGAAMAFGVFIESELTRPFQARIQAIDQLSALRREISEQAACLPGGRSGQLGMSQPESVSTAERAAAYDARRPKIDEILRALGENDLARTFIGVGAVRNLSERVQEARDAAQSLFSGAADDGGLAALRVHAEIQDFIERTERRTLEDAGSAVGYSEEMRRMHQIVLASGIAGSLLAVTLATALFSRWVLTPVGDLRFAAGQIAAGNYFHESPVRARDELGELALEINRMARMVAAAQAHAVERERLAAMGSLVGRLAHNLRNPLSAIRSLAELTCRRAPDNEQIRRDQNEIVGAVDRFNEWLTELVRVGAPLELSREPTNQRNWWEHVLASQRPLARMRSVELAPQMDCLPAIINIDRRRLEHAMVVLLTNAIQASPPGGRVCVRTKWDASGGWWEAQVLDQGPGVPDELKQKIFQPYFTSKPDGNGIGLAIARQVVLAHGGEISVIDNPEGGAAFVVRLPFESSIEMG